MDACLPEPLPDWSRIAAVAVDMPHVPSGPQTADYLEHIARTAVGRALGEAGAPAEPVYLAIADYLLVWCGAWVPAPDWDATHNHYGARYDLYRRIRTPGRNTVGAWEHLVHPELPTFEAVRRHIECETGAIVEPIPASVPNWCRGGVNAWQFVPRAMTYARHY